MQDSKVLLGDKITRAAGLVTVSLGIVVLLGWWLHIDTAKRIVPGLVSMNPTTALLFLLFGSSLLIERSRSAGGWWLTEAIPAVCLLVALSKLVDYGFDTNIDIDRRLFRSQLSGPSEPLPNRMAPTTAFCFACLALSLLVTTQRARTSLWAVVPTSVCLVVATLAVAGYLYGAQSVTSLSPFIPMALHTAVGFLVLGVGVMASCLGTTETIAGPANRFVWKLYFGYLAVIMFTTIITGVLVDRQVEEEFVADSYQLLEAKAMLLGETARASLENAAPFPDLTRADAMTPETPFHLSLFDREGRIVADSELRPEDLAARAPALHLKQEMEAARSAEKVQAIRRRTRDGRVFMFLTVPVRTNGTVIGFARAGMSMETISNELGELRTRLFQGTLAGLLAAVLLGALFARRIRKRLLTIIESARALSDGDLSRRVAVTGRDEIAFLGSTFNRMAERLATQVTELHEARERAEDATRAKSLFLSQMSHEIRTPLNGVVGMLDLLQRTELSDKQRRYIDVAKSSGDTLATLVNNVLDISKLQAGKLEIETIEFNLDDVVENAIEIVSYPANDKRLDVISHIQPGIPRRLIGDPTRLKQVLVNLLANAVKFTAKGEVLVRVLPADSADGRLILRFEVSDTGIGIPRESFEKIFYAFSQASSSTTRTYGGTGLGLSITKQLVECMGGSLGLESEVGKGSMFWFTLPFEQAAEYKEKQREFPTDPRSLRVLVVDDSESYRSLLTEHLTSWGMQVTACSDMHMALWALEVEREDTPFHIAIIDGDLGEHKGFELAQRIRRDEQDDEKIVLIIMLALGEELHASEIEDLGFQGFIPKPIRQSRLFDSIMDGLSALKDPNRPHSMVLHGSVAERSRHSLRVLLVEDNAANQLVASEILTYLGHTFDIVGNGELAVAAAEKSPYDIILMDCQMPVMDGLEATRRIRAAESNRPGGAAPVPIVALTANASSEDRERCFAAGMNEYCTKPINPEHLGRLLQTLCAASPSTAESPERRPEKSAAASASPFDLGALLARVGKNHRTADQVLQQLDVQIRDTLGNIDELFRDNDAEKLANLLHALRGAAALIDATSLTSVAKTIELAAREGRMDRAKEETAKLRIEANSCLEFIPEARQILALNPAREPR